MQYGLGSAWFPPLLIIFSTYLVLCVYSTQTIRYEEISFENNPKNSLIREDYLDHLLYVYDKECRTKLQSVKFMEY